MVILFFHGSLGKDFVKTAGLAFFLLLVPGSKYNQFPSVSASLFQETQSFFRIVAGRSCIRKDTISFNAALSALQTEWLRAVQFLAEWLNHHDGRCLVFGPCEIPGFV